MLVSHLSALTWVTAAAVGRPTNTSSSITEGRYNATYVSHMLTNPIKSTQTLSELQIPINVLFMPRHCSTAGIRDNFIIAWCLSSKWGIILYNSAILHKSVHLTKGTHLYTLIHIRIWKSIHPGDMCKSYIEIKDYGDGMKNSFFTLWLSTNMRKVQRTSA